MMQDYMDLTTQHYNEGPEFDIGWRMSSPLMLSPTNEMSNPFFAMMRGGGDLSQTLILDLGLGNAMPSKQPRLTPSEYTFAHRQEDFLELDYFGLETSLNRQLHPTRLSSASLESTTSSGTPSEADSDLIEQVSQDEELELLKLDMASCSFPMSPNVGLGFHLGYVPSAARSYGRSTSEQQYSPAPSSASISLNNFNLSDFISEHEVEQYHSQQQQQQQQQQQHQRSTTTNTPNRPLALHDLRLQAVRSTSYSPASSMSPQTSVWEGGHLKQSLLRSSVKREYEQETVATHADVFSHGQESGHLRPKMPMRAYTDSTAEIFSCNPSQITPSHAHLMEQLSEGRPGYFYSLNQGQEAEQGIFNSDEYPTSPTSLYSSPTQEYHNLWSSIEGESKQDVFDGNSSPLFNAQDTRTMSLPQSSSHQPQEPTDYFISMNSLGAVRSARSSAMAASRRSSLPYESPLSKHGRIISLDDAKMIATMPGIITKRSRGRRVPSNPEELSNLGKSGKIYTCKVPGCGKCFKRSEHLKRHVRSIHTNEKPFTCHCGKTFSRHDNLNQHARVHTMDGEDGSTSESASASPATSPTPLPSGYVQSQRSSFHLANSRLRKAVIADEEEQEANMFD